MGCNKFGEDAVSAVWRLLCPALSAWSTVVGRWWMGLDSLAGKNDCKDSEDRCLGRFMSQCPQSGKHWWCLVKWIFIKKGRFKYGGCSKMFSVNDLKLQQNILIQAKYLIKFSITFHSQISSLSSIGSLQKSKSKATLVLGTNLKQNIQSLKQL